MFVLKHDQGKIAAFEKNLLDISSPKSANYGKWLSSAEVAAAISPA